MDPGLPNLESRPQSGLETLAVVVMACSGVVLLLAAVVEAAVFRDDPQKDFEAWEAGQIIAEAASWAVTVVAVVLSGCVALTRGGARRFAAGLLVFAILLGILLLARR